VRAIEAAKKGLCLNMLPFLLYFLELVFDGICCHKLKGKYITFNKTSAQYFKIRAKKQTQAEACIQANSHIPCRSLVAPMPYPLPFRALKV
jgi:hypothetical protein